MSDAPPPSFPGPQETIDEIRGHENKLLRRLEFSRRQLIAIIAIVVFLFALLVVWLVPETLGPSGQPDVKLWFDAGQAPVSGSETQFTVLYENHDSQPLRNVVLELLYPDGFRFSSSQPESQDGVGRSFNLPEVTVGGLGQVVISGIFSGSPNETKLVRARLFYQLKNTSSTFTTDAETGFSLQAPNFNLQIIAPSELVNSQNIDYLVSFQNISEEDLDRVQIRLTYPNGFAFTHSSLPVTRPGVWEIGHLAIGQSGELKISGFLTGTVGEEKILNADLGYLTDDGSFTIQSRAFLSTRLQDSPIQVRQSLTDSSSILEEGQGITYNVDYENVGVQGMSNVRIIMKIESSAADFTTVQTSGGALVQNEVIWNAAGRPELALVQPGEKGSIGLSFRLKKDLAAVGVKSPFVRTSLFVASDELPERTPAQKVELPIRSKITVATNLVHVSGPVPLEPGQQTVYEVTLKVANSVNDLTGVIGQLVVNVPLVNLVEGSVSPPSASPNFNYTLSSGRVTWRVGSLPAFGTAQLSFRISATTSVAQPGSGAVLIKSIQMSGHDEYVDQVISASQVADIFTQ